METVQNQLIIGDKILHMETDAECVLFNNSNAKNYLDKLVSTDNMPQFMQNFLQAKDYIEANQILKTNPETYFDECFNNWTTNVPPTISNGVCDFGATGYLQADSQFVIGNESFTVEARIKNGSTLSANNRIGAFTNAYGAQVRTEFGIDQNFYPYFAYNNASSTAWTLTGNATVTANTWIHFEVDYDHTAGTMYLFVNGSAKGSIDKTISTAFNKFRIGTNTYKATPTATDKAFNGEMDYIRVSNICRHKTSFTPQTPTRDDNTLSLLLFE